MTERKNRSRKLRRKRTRTTKRTAESYERRPAGSQRCHACRRVVSRGGRKFAGELCFRCTSRALKLKVRKEMPDAALRKYVSNVKLSGNIE